MRWLTRALLFGTLAAAIATELPAQRGGGRGGNVPLPSSTALGAGALNFGPSSTARSTAAARGTITYGRGGRARVTYGRNNRGLPLAYWLAPYYYPPDYADSYYGGAPDYDTSVDPNEQAAMMAQRALVDQVQRLSAQMAQMQYGQQAQPQQYAMQQEPPPPPQVPVTLVLRDGHQLQVQNYAVMDQTFWDFTRQPVRKIPLSSIDVAASAKATEAKGGEFPQLATP